jgi:hypothetical protein
MKADLTEWLDISCEQLPYSRGAKVVLNEQNRRYAIPCSLHSPLISMRIVGFKDFLPFLICVCLAVNAVTVSLTQSLSVILSLTSAMYVCVCRLALMGFNVLRNTKESDFSTIYKVLA